MCESCTTTNSYSKILKNGAWYAQFCDLHNPVTLLQQMPEVFKYLSLANRSNIELIKIAIKANYKNMKYAIPPPDPMPLLEIAPECLIYLPSVTPQMAEVCFVKPTKIPLLHYFHDLPRDLVLRAIRSNPRNIKHTVCDDAETLKFAVSRYPHAVKYANPHIIADIVPHLNISIKTAHLAKYMNNDDFMTAMVLIGKCGHCYRYLSQRLRNNFRIIEAAIKDYPDAVVGCNVPRLIIMAIGVNPWLARQYPQYEKYAVTAVNSLTDYFIYYPDLVADNVEFMRILCRGQGRYLSVASMAVRCDYECVLNAVSNYGYAIMFASMDLRNCFEICRAACANNIDVLSLCGGNILSDRAKLLQILSAAGSGTCNVLLNLPEEMKNDAEVVRHAIRINVLSIKSAVYQDEEIHRVVVSKYPYLIQYCRDPSWDIKCLALKKLMAPIPLGIDKNIMDYQIAINNPSYQVSSKYMLRKEMKKMGLARDYWALKNKVKLSLIRKTHVLNIV